MTSTLLISLFIVALVVIAIGAMQASVMRRRDLREHRFVGHSPEFEQPETPKQHDD
ncbi:MAG: hypothetical protein H7123_02035, partial [Thermoleophilia bacterium]|nr:hypothetical protein [Thermoleophilia bacterium]